MTNNDVALSALQDHGSIDGVAGHGPDVMGALPQVVLHRFWVPTETVGNLLDGPFLDVERDGCCHSIGVGHQAINVENQEVVGS